MRTYVTEFIGTFFLVLVIGLSVMTAGSMAPLAIGAMLMVMVYAGGHISGAHYNPAVSLAAFLRGKLPARDLLPYVIVQLAAAAAASLIVWALLGRTPRLPTDLNHARALLNEVLFTFALALVVLNSATVAKTEGNSYFGLAIGFTVASAAYAGGPISGGAYNPAVGLALCLMDLIADGDRFAYLWFYLVGPLAGGALATIVFKLQNPVTDTATPRSVPEPTR